MAENPEAIAGPTGNDIIFDCPYCGKSLAIDSRGAGLTIQCPDCRQEVGVPALVSSPPTEMLEPEPGMDENPVVRIKNLTAALAASQAKVERLVSSLEEVRERRRFLEKLRTENMGRFEQIGKELVVIQNAMDRIVGMLQDAASEKLSDEV